MQIAIVEDCKEHSELIKQYIDNWSRMSEEKVAIRQFDSAEQFLFHSENATEIDTIFMDIQMPGLSGVELARKIREKNHQVAIVFTTGIDDYMEEGYELEATHYLLKPVSEEKVRRCLDKISEKQKKKEHYIILHGEEDTFRIAESNIWWVSALGHKVIVGMEEAGGVKRIHLSNSMGEMEKILFQLPEFVKSHRSYIVNLKHVKSIRKADIIMDNGDEIPLSRRMYKEVNERFIQFFAKGKGETWL